MRKIIGIFIVYNLYLTSYSQINPIDIGDLILWLSSDSVLLNGIGVETWYDKSGSNNHATQSNATNMPNFIASVNQLNSFSSIQFDGTNDFFELPNTAMPIQNHTVYVLAKSNNDISNKTLYARAYTTSGYFIRVNSSTNFTINNVSNTSTISINDNNYKLLRFDYNGTQMRTYINTILSGSINHPTPGPIVYNVNDAASIGALRGTSSGTAWFHNGEIVEIMVFSKLLNDTESSLINNYFRSKYAPPVSLQSDTIFYSFCPFTLNAGSRYTSYLWSTGETTESITINQSGTYWIRVTDIFGFVSSDTINVTYPTILIPPNNVFCPGDSIIWNTGLGNDYQYLWSNGHTTSSIIINSSNFYNVTITDTFNCSRSFPAIYFNEDDYQSIVSLGPDTNLCNGNTLSLLNGNNNSISYLWNTGATSSSIVLDTSGTYIVTVVNQNNCTAQDTIHITIVGNAPHASFIAQNFCTGSPTLFTDQSTTGNVIQQWKWNWGDGSPIETTQHPMHTYSLPGNYSVTLTVTTDVGCSDDTTQWVTIWPLPSADFAVIDSCERGNAVFADQSVANAGTLVQWHWNFGVPTLTNDTSNIANPHFSYPTHGIYPVQLIVANSMGCKDTVSRLVQIKQAGTANFTVNKECFGEPVVFTNLSFAGFPLNITAYQWYFGTISNDSTGVVNPSFTYNAPGIYPVTLVVSTDNGCKHAYTDTLHINKFVDAAMLLPDDTLCRGQSYLLTDNSNYSNTQPAQWQWSISGANIGNQNPQSVTFNQTGLRQVRLIVTSTDNCVDSAKTNVFIKNPPIASFTATPQVSAPPLNTVLQYTGTPGVSLAWDLGDNTTATGSPVTHTYQQVGLYPVTLIATDANGCSDSATRTMNVVVPIFNVQLNNLVCTETNGYVQLQATIQNLSTITITGMNLEGWIEGAQPALEHWQGELFIGNSLNYQSPYSLQLPYQGSSYCCLRIKDITGVISDTSLNKTLCVALQNTFMVFPPFPNPTTGPFSMHVILPIADEAVVSITDLQGKLLYEQAFTFTAGLHTLPMDASFLSAGVYAVAVYYRGERQVVRLLKQD